MTYRGKSISCETVTRVLSDYLDGHLPLPQRIFLRAHLLVGPTCEVFLESLKGVKRLGQSALPEDEIPGEVKDMVGALLKRFKEQPK